MTELHAISPGLLTVLAFWALWLVLDPALRPGDLSKTHLILWLLAPLGMYLVLARHPHPEGPPAPPIGREGTVTQLSPLQVELFGSPWQARCEAAGDLRVGDRVRVVGREGLTLVVERAS